MSESKFASRVIADQARSTAFFFLISGLMLPVLAVGQKRRAIKTPKNESVILVPSYVDSDTVRSMRVRELTRAGYSFSNFDPTVLRLPTNYRGNPLVFVTKELHFRFNLADKKGEFESTSEFNRRILERRSGAIIQGTPLKPSGYVAFLVEEFESKYDADAEILEIRSRPMLMSLRRVNDLGTEMIRGETKPTWLLNKQIEDVVTLNGLEKGEVDYTISTTAVSVPQSYQWRLPIPRKNARSAKANLRMLVIGKIDFESERPVENDSWEDFYRLNLKQIEIWLFDSQTGDVLRKNLIQ